MHQDIFNYHLTLSPDDQDICNLLYQYIEEGLSGANGKVRHRHPVWFLDGNPIVGYSREKRGLRLMFWSGADFEEDGLDIKGEKFKDASVFYRLASDMIATDIQRRLSKAKDIQRDYKNIVKRKGKLEKLTVF